MKRPFRILHREELIGWFDVTAESKEHALNVFQTQAKRGEIDFSHMDLISSENTAVDPKEDLHLMPIHAGTPQKQIPFGVNHSNALQQKNKALAYFETMAPLQADKSFQIAEVMYILRDLGLSTEEMYQISCKLQESIKLSSEPFLYHERIDAVRYLLEFGISDRRLNDGFSALPKLTQEQAKGFLLSTDEETLAVLIDTVASENRDYYLVTAPEDVLSREDGQAMLQKLQPFLSQKPSLNDQIQAADTLSNQSSQVSDGLSPAPGKDAHPPIQR